ncbi:LysR family transcriptional regulator [Pseudomonas prosekii]|uniref:LysR family transcriptional regulator n=1 Tax=Pseudomonas prosekii TaxID=1148509 RepID=A0A3L8CDJ9_9PSED|nr:LysR family transcriptional regulator [Pseudomonas prosekii]RLU05781.1 LysR family transcriptional regulator [Pseudomonas prosekii]RLU11805.1 LysR family transcriptional regulator [Pseudomonas prosekii]
MHLKAHRYFAMVAVTGSFTATARHFQVPASSVSRFIAALEREVGQQLLYRNTRAVKLTDAGERYYLQIRDVLELLDAADEEIMGKGAEAGGLVRINAPVAFGSLHIVKLLNGLYDKYPKLTVELTVTDAYIDPIQEGADLIFRVGHLQDSGLIGRKICDQQYVLCASADYLKKHGKPSSPQDLKNHACLVYKGTGGAQRWFFRAPGDGQSGSETVEIIDVHGPLRSNNAQVLVEASLAGRGVVFFPSWLFSRESFVNQQLIRLLPEWQGSVEQSPSQIHLLSPENRLRSQKVRVVWDYFLQAIGTPPYWDDLGDGTQTR